MRKTLSRITSFVMGIVGIFILTSTLFPILSYEFSSLDSFSNYLSPVPEKDLTVIEKSGDDLTLASNWFEGGAKKEDFTKLGNIDYYTLSIPKFKIENAKVSVGGEDLSENLIQYPGTALPGRMGNTVIFGHSTLPQLYKPDNPLSAFNFVPQIKKGAEILINYDGMTYRYVVRETMEVLPTQIEVLAQRYDKYELTLITCVPLGTYLRRFVTRAELVN